MFAELKQKEQAAIRRKVYEATSVVRQIESGRDPFAVAPPISNSKFLDERNKLIGDTFFLSVI